MPEETRLASAAHLAVTLAWVAGAIVGAYLVGWAVSWVLLRVARRSDFVRDLVVFTRWPGRAILMVVAATITLDSVVAASVWWRGRVDHFMHIMLIATVTWLLTSLVRVAERRSIDRFGGGDGAIVDADRDRRRVRTHVITLRRLAIAVTVVFGSAAALMTFPGFAQLGTTLFASAGVLSVVAGLAAQTALGAVFAGMQISFSGAIRVGDVVVIEGEFGRIEEITMTYVVVQIWDLRRLVLPTTYFTTTPFENWTRHANELLGTVELDLDFTVPFDAMRAELERQLSENDLWDGNAGVLWVTDAVDGYLRVRLTVSARNSSELFMLRCAIREGMVDWLRRTDPGALPRRRIEYPPAGAATTEPDRLAGAYGYGNVR